LLTDLGIMEVIDPETGEVKGEGRTGRTGVHAARCARHGRIALSHGRLCGWRSDLGAFAGGTRAINDQVRFEREWSALRVYAHSRGVRLIGDVPIYVAAGSADHLRWPELFLDDVVAGVPPDAFTARGQLWGNPIYDWAVLRRRAIGGGSSAFAAPSSCSTWRASTLPRASRAYWAVPRGARDASGGRWVRGPGRAVFDAARAELGRLPLIAEDLA